MTNSKKRGFTIIELVIVIAVIAILAGVLIPTFVSVIKKANVSSDTALVRNINEALAAEDVTDKPTTMYQALKVAKEYGFSVEKLTPRSSGEIVWNSTSNRFALVEDGKVVYSANGEQIPNDATVWKIAHEEKGLDAKYSNYLAYEVAAETTLTVTSGLDVGENTGVNVIYNGTQNVTIRTNGGTLEINAENSEVAHYGAADFTNIVAVKENSYHEFGVSAYVSIAKGRFVAEATAKVIELNVVNSSVIVATEQGATIAGYSKGAADVTVTVNGATVEVSKERTTDQVKTASQKSAVVENGVAEINGIQFKDLQSAFDIAKNGDTVKLLENVDLKLTVSLEDGKSITLDSNGKTVSNTSDLWDVPNEAACNWSLISVRAGSLTITGNGSFVAKANDCYAVDLQDGAKCVIENGTFVGNISAVYVNKGELTVNGGRYSILQTNTNGVAGPYDYVLNCLDDNRKNGTARISVVGGTFEMFNPANNKAEGAGTNFCAEGYTVVESTIPGTESNIQYTVVKAN